MIRWLVLFFCVAGSAMAETARVYSGEHADFTRLVIELPANDDWTVGRTSLGYAFATGGKTQPNFDVSEVWDRIPKTRLQGLRTDPETGVLQLTLACACHVFPFEYQPGIIVLDIKPGQAPSGSAFETPFLMPMDNSASGKPTTLPSPEYDWLEVARTSPLIEQGTGEIALPTGGISLDPLRAELLEQISRGAAQGVVDMALPGKPVSVEPLNHGTPPWSQIHIGPPRDTTIAELVDGTGSLTPSGAACIADDRLDLADWGGGHPPLELLSEARSGLYGEFDGLDAGAALRAVQLHLYLGFGAEAAQYAELVSADADPEDVAILRSLARLVDGEADPQSPFLTMLACDGAAALWALAAQGEIPPGAKVNTDAIARSFLALPAHLRGALGVGLAEKLLAHGDDEAARIVRNAIERTPDVHPAKVVLLDASADLHADAAEAAIDHAETAVAMDGRTVDEWIALVEAHFRRTAPVSPDVVTALRAFEGEVGGTAEEAGFFRALALAELLSGQTEAGFEIAVNQDLPASDLWQVAAVLAEDDAFLGHAVVAQPPSVSPKVAEDVAERLLDLGFPDAALAWLQPLAADDGPRRRRIAARAELARKGARQALDLLDGLSEPEDMVLRAQAMVQLGQVAMAREAYLTAGMSDEALRLATWEGAWTEVAMAEVPLWSPVASDAEPRTVDAAGTLARGAAILEASETTRGSIEALLAGVTDPGS